jgi:hypothetical protein
MDEQVPGPGPAPAQTPQQPAQTPQQPATPRPPMRPRPDFKPVEAQPVPTSWGMRIVVVLIVLGIGTLGAYIYGRSKMTDVVNEFQEEADKQRQSLLGFSRAITAADLQAFAERVIAQHGLKLTPGSLRTLIQPYPSPTGAYQPNVRVGLRRAPYLPKGSRPGWVVGFSAEVTARVGIVARTFTTDHYTLIE